MKTAQIILDQLGGTRFRLMTGAKHIVGGDNFVQFKLPANFAKNKINFVKVTLDVTDTYTVEFFNFRGLNLKEVAKIEGVYADRLQAVFTEQTGLDTKL